MSSLYHSGPMGALTQPRQYARRETGAFAPGLRGGSTGTTLPLPGAVADGGPQFNARYASGATHADFANDGIVQESNGRGVQHMTINPWFYEPGDVVADTPLFIRRKAPGALPDTLKECSHEMKCFTELVRHLKHDRSARHEVGAHITAKRLLDEWAYVGVLQTKTEELEKTGAPLSDLNMIIHGRARMPNMWLANETAPRTSQCSVRELHSLYMVARRYPYSGERALHEAWEPQQRRGGRKRDRTGEATTAAAATAVVPKPVAEPYADQEKKLSEMEAHAATASAQTTLSTASGGKLKWVAGDAPQLTTDNAKQEYYWTLEPYTSYDRSPPPLALYTGDPRGDPNNQFVGDWIYVGQVVHLAKGHNNRTPQQVKWARDAFYTDVRNMDYYPALRKLDEIEVFLQCNRPMPINI